MTAVVDMYPKVFRRGYRRELLILALSVVSYFLGLVMLTEVSGEDRARPEGRREIPLNLRQPMHTLLQSCLTSMAARRDRNDPLTLVIAEGDMGLLWASS